MFLVRKCILTLLSVVFYKYLNELLKFDNVRLPHISVYISIFLEDIILCVFFLYSFDVSSIPDVCLPVSAFNIFRENY